LDELIAIKEATGKVLHLDIEPEPDGILENSTEFITWYEDYLRPIAIEYFAKKEFQPKKHWRFYIHIFNYVMMFVTLL